jgi:cell growth-regulating nucleolar protein
MVSFNCTRCQDVVKKPKVVSHAASCGAKTFSCVDCMLHFDLDSIKNHTSCVSEVQKYQGKWKGPANKNYGPDSDDEDEEMKKKHEATKALHQERRRPRQMNFNDDSSDDDDDDKKKTTKKNAPPAKTESKKQQENNNNNVEVKKTEKPKAKKEENDDDDEEAEVKQPGSKSPANSAAVVSTPVVCSFEVAPSRIDFQKFVKSVIAEYEPGMTVKAAAKVVTDKIISEQSKTLRAAVQALIADNLKTDGEGRLQ